MKLSLKIIILVWVFLLWLYVFDPSLFQRVSETQDNTINTQQYVLTPNPAKFFLFNLKVSSSKNYNTDGIVWWTKLYFEAVNLFNTNIINLLENSNNDKRIVLNTYLAQLTNIQNRLDNTIVNLRNNYNEEFTLYQTYLASKQEWDQQFTNGFIDKDASIVAEWLSKSYQNGPKATEHRILADWWNIVLKKLNFVKLLVDAKLLLLTNNKDNIVNNFALIKWNMLIKLLKIKQRLETNYYN